MDALHVPLAAAAGLLVVSGAAKLARPTTTTRALRVVGIPASDGAVRGLGGIEAIVGLGTLTIAGRWWSAATALLYFGFATFVVVALWRGTPLASCGCFGAADTPPTLVHVGIDAGLGAAAALAAADDLAAPLEVVTDGDGAIALVLGSLALGALLYLALTRDLTRQGSHPTGE